MELSEKQGYQEKHINSRKSDNRLKKAPFIPQLKKSGQELKESCLFLGIGYLIYTQYIAGIMLSTVGYIFLM